MKIEVADQEVKFDTIHVSINVRTANAQKKRKAIIVSSNNGNCRSVT